VEARPRGMGLGRWLVGGLVDLHLDEGVVVRVLAALVQAGLRITGRGITVPAFAIDVRMDEVVRRTLTDLAVREAAGLVVSIPSLVGRDVPDMRLVFGRVLSEDDAAVLLDALLEGREPEDLTPPGPWAPRAPGPVIPARGKPYASGRVRAGPCRGVAGGCQAVGATELPPLKLRRRPPIAGRARV
jgi:hypothetical protein